jgi:hypothetical protein
LANASSYVYVEVLGVVVDEISCMQVLVKEVENEAVSMQSVEAAIMNCGLI